ncbi:MAG TPA: DUF2207 domain-containing protein [Allosphingosinicella sp.]|jgi:uncharacterized membrane protein YgcG
MHRLVLALLGALALVLPGAADAEERILRFLSDVSVERDGTLAVTETIRVRSEGDQIKRGIYRDFPTRYADRQGRKLRVGFDVLGVERDGRAEPFEVESIDNGDRVRIGDAEVLLPPGEHEYVIRYQTTRQLGFFKGYDELYWNATGTGWAFPIDVAEARIRLPEPARFGNRAFYTGPQGSTDRYAEVVSEAPGEIVFRTTAPLGPQEGLTVAAAWPKGVVEAPAPRSANSLWLQDNVPVAAALLGLLGIAGYYFYAWRKVGRGPDAGPIVPLFSPPDDMSPAAMRYVSEMGSYDDRTFAAALVDLGVRGRLRLVEGEKKWLSRPDTTIEKTGGDERLPKPEASMFGKLFEAGESVLMDDANHSIFSAARSALHEELQKAYDGKLFIHNRAWAAAGIPLLLGAMWLAAIAIIATDPELPDRNGSLAIGGVTVVPAILAYLCYRLTKRQGTAARVLGWLGAALFALAALALAAVTCILAAENERLLPLVIPFAAIPLMMSGFWWMSAPTRTGREVMDRIAGFRQYLSITEEERLETMHPPEKTPQLFERYLPHAIALDVENAWASRFTSVLAAAGAAGQTGSMGWYSGHSSPWNDVDDFVDRVGSSLSSSVSSASTAPGSSSGSGGGGSSGGGGGGGGGGGW